MTKCPRSHRRTDSAPLIISSFGVCWHKDEVVWGYASRILGTLGEDAPWIDFSNQNGVYVLYMEEEVVYVGVSCEGFGACLSRRVEEMYWDRFSWFAFSQGADEEQPAEVFPSDAIIHAAGGILAALLQPRKVGESIANPSAVEYFQIPLERS